MANFFDQFDKSAASAPAAVPAQQGGNFFDQFDNNAMPVSEDVARSLGRGVVQGTIGLAGMAGDLRNAMNKGFDWTMAKLGATPPTPEQWEQYEKQVPHLGPQMPTSAQVQSGLESVTGPMNFQQPQTGAGEVAQTVGQFLPAAMLGPGGVAAKTARFALAPALASEAAGYETQNMPAVQPYAKTGAALLASAINPSRLVTPNPISAERATSVAALEKEGIPLTAGDRTGNATLRATESELATGVDSAQRQAFTQAAFDRVGEPVGDRPITGQNGVVDSMMKRIGGQFDTLANRNTARADPQFYGDLQATAAKYLGTPGLYADETTNAVRGAVGRVNDTFQANGWQMPGPQYQALRSNLRAAAQGATDPQKSEAIHSVVNALDDAMERSIAANNPTDLGAWGQARKDYRNALVLQRWAGSANMTPATLAQSAKAIYGKNQYVRGMDDFSDLAESGRTVLGQFPDSGTPRRQIVEKVISGGSKALGAAIGGGLGYASGLPEGGIGGIILGEVGGPFVGRPIARKVLMSGPAQGYLANQLMKGVSMPPAGLQRKLLATQLLARPDERKNEPATLQ